MNISPGTDLSLAKQLCITFITESHQALTLLDLPTFFPQIQTLFPKVLDIVIYTDCTSSPSTSLFDIGQELSTSPDTQGYSGEFVHNQAAFIPFSHGPYNCVGKNLALLEMKMVICHLLQNFDIRFDERWNTDDWERDMLDVFVMKKGKLPVHIALRHPSA